LDNLWNPRQSEQPWDTACCLTKSSTNSHVSKISPVERHINAPVLFIHSGVPSTPQEQALNKNISATILQCKPHTTVRNYRKITDTSWSISPIMHDKKPRRSPLRLRFLTYILEEISCANCITYFPTIPKDI